MRALAVVTCFVLCGGAARAQPVANEHELLVRQLLKELADQGFRVDAEALKVEVKPPLACEEDVDRQQDLFFRAGHFTGAAGLLSALVQAEVRLSDAEVRRAAVQGVLRSIPAYYQWDTHALVFPQNALSKATETMGNREAVIAHELAHAFQAQRRGGIPALVQSPPRWTDRVQAARCLMEGEAELIALSVLLGRKGKGLDALTEEHLARGAALEEELTGVGSALYDVGRRALLRAHRTGGWKAVEAQVLDPPSSSEQLLHLNKLGRDLPTEVPGQTLEGFELLYEDVVGELQAYFYLRQLGVDDAGRATCGWDGDRLQVFRDANRQRLVVWRSVWDSEQDAREFAAAIPAQSRVRQSGRWVDVVWSNGLGLAEEVRGRLAPPPEVAASAEDAASTREAERALAERRAKAESSREGTRWEIPQAGVALRLPVSWTTRDRGATFLALAPHGPQVRFRDNVNVQVQPNPIGLDLDDHLKFNRDQLNALPDMEVVDFKKDEVQGRPLLKCRFKGTVDFDKLEFECWIFPREHDQIVITGTVLSVRDQKLKDTVHTILESVEFTGK